MKYYSLNNPSIYVDFSTATIRGQAPDRGLYFPKDVPVLPDEFLENLHRYSREEIAFRVIRPYTGDTLPEAELERIITETLNFESPADSIDPVARTQPFEFPLIQITPAISALFSALVLLLFFLFSRQHGAAGGMGSKIRAR